MFNETLLDSFSLWYRPVHGYTSLIICMLGIALNFFNIIVLTRRHMISSTNSILTAIAIADFLTMFVYIPTSLKFYCILETNYIEASNCRRGFVTKCNYFWTLYALFFVNFTVTMHSISIWLTVLLAFFRYVYICRNKIGKKLCTQQNTTIAIVVTIFLCIIFCVPSYFVSKIVQIESDSTTYYQIRQSDIDQRTNGLIFRITFFSQAFCVKLIPCILLIILSSLLVRSIHIANRKNLRLMTFLNRRRPSDKSKEHSRTNKMLVLVCFIFFLTEFPQGILAIMSIIYESNDFHSKVYMKLGDVMDIISLTNNAINFILYCLMNPIFRQTFKTIICMRLVQ